jgi:hypothetical protein
VCQSSRSASLTPFSVPPKWSWTRTIYPLQTTLPFLCERTPTPRNPGRFFGLPQLVPYSRQARALSGNCVETITLIGMVEK